MPEDGRFEQEVHGALRRMDAPMGFADRVMERASQSESTSALPIPAVPAQASRGRLLAFPSAARQQAWRMAYAAAALLAITAGAMGVEHVRTERRANAAAAQFEQAMQVTSHALDHASAQLQRTEFGGITQALQQDQGGKR